MSEISYEHLVEKALLHVVHDALAFAQKNGLNKNHFYISFQTQHPNVVLSEHLKMSYPEDITIVLQHEYTDLEVDANGFSVTLSFGNAPERITVPFCAITRFADPFAQFALSFNPETPVKKESEKEKIKNIKAVEKTGENIVSLSAFRKKK